MRLRTILLLSIATAGIVPQIVLWITSVNRLDDIAHSLAQTQAVAAAQLPGV